MNEVVRPDATPAVALPPPTRGLSPLNRRRLANFRRNRLGYWSFLIFTGLFVTSLFAEFIANDRPLVVSYKGEILFPVVIDYPDEKFGGFYARPDYRSAETRKEIAEHGWAIWPPIPYSYATIIQGLPRRSVSPSESPAPNSRRTGSAPTTPPATCSPASSTAFASRCCSG